MASLTLRLVKGSPLTYQEVDDNFTNLNNELGSVSGGSAINSLINSNFDVWQRGTSFNLSGATTTYTADRWACAAGTSGVSTVSRVAFTAGQTDVPGEPQFFLRHQRTTAATAANSPILQRIENVRSHAGSDVTFSIWAKVGAGSKSLIPRTVQNFGSGGSASVTKTASAITVTTSWQRFEITITNDSISGKTIGAGNYLQVDLLEDTGFGTFTLDFAQSQVESGSSATAFVPRIIAEELALCRRYYEKTYDAGTDPGAVGAVTRRATYIISSISNGQVWGESFGFVVPKRSAPTINLIASDGTSGAITVAGTTRTAAAGAGENGIVSVTNNSGTTWTAGNAVLLHFTADAEL